jgi:hypothetical protein
MSASTLNGHRVLKGSAHLHSWGCWHAEAQIDGEHTLSGSVTFKLADLTLVGTVLSGGPEKGRSSYRIVAGAGGWGQSIAAKSYSNDASDKASTVVGDAASAVGETLAPIAATVRVGTGFTRPEGPASQVLQIVAPQGWYVDEAGVTHLGSRTAGALVGKVTRVTPVDLARGKLVLAADSIATILPGIVVDGLTAVDVLHEVSAEGGLRTTLWGAQVSSPIESLRRLLEALDPDRKFRGVTEYRVVTLSGSLLNLQPVRRASSGMPDLQRVPVRPGVAGCEATVALGSRVLVGFVDSDAARPYVAGFEDADGAGFLPTMIELAGGADFVALAASVSTQLSTLKNAITGAGVTPADGGLAFKTALLASLAAWPGSVAATKVKAT